VKKDIVIAVVAVIIVVALAFGLSTFRSAAPGSAATPAAASSDSARAAGGEKVVMRVNGEPVTEREFNLFVMSAPEQARAFYASPAGRRALSDELVKLKVLEQEAKRLRIADEPDVKSQLQMAQSQILASRALEKLADAKTEQRVKEEYEKEKSTAISLRHILIAYKGGQVPARGGKEAGSADAAMSKAAGIVTRLRGGGDFASTARAESDDEQSGQQGGMLGPAKPENLPPDIAGAVAKLKPGQISDPVKTQFGVHIFKVEQPSLEDLRPMLRQKVRQQVAETEVKRLEDAAKVDLDPAFFPPAKQAPPAIPQQAPQGTANPNG
jgi:peptidyl-prolyl cis-trans isomerase C